MEKFGVIEGKISISVLYAVAQPYNGRVRVNISSFLNYGHKR